MKFKHAKPTIVEADMTPMIDMTFQLIAFFMIVTNFDQTQADERVKLPSDQLARPPLVAREDELVINVGYKRNLAGESIAGPFVFYTGEDVPVLEFGPRFQREFLLVEKVEGKAKAQEMTVVIRSDGDVPTGLIQELIKMGQEAQFVKFALKAKAATEGEEE